MLLEQRLVRLVSGRARLEGAGAGQGGGWRVNGLADLAGEGACQGGAWGLRLGALFAAAEGRREHRLVARGRA